MDRKPVFDAIRKLRLGKAFTPGEVAQVDALLDALLPSPRTALLTEVTEHLEAEEGLRVKAYRDSESYWTIGIGRLIDLRKGGLIYPAEEKRLMAADPSRKAGDWRNWVLTPDECRYLLAQDIERAIATFETEARLRPAWDAVRGDVFRQVALISMVFQLGAIGLSGFKNTLRLISERKFEAAAANSLQSLWAEQTPNRARRVAQMLATGKKVTA